MAAVPAGTAAPGAALQTNAPAVRPELPKAIPEDVQQVVRNWNSIVQDMPGLEKVYLKQARLSLGGDNRLMIVLDEPVAAEMLDKEDRRKEIERIISERIDGR